MTEPPLHRVACLHGPALQRVAYRQWGDPANPQVVLCVHGLTRQGRDFDALARALAPDRRVVCPDLVGHGRSERLADPRGYALPTYVADMITLLARIDAASVDWVGTSMGGLIGLAVAALGASPVRRLVLNDVGPALDPRGLQRIAASTGCAQRWSSLGEAADALWAMSPGFGPHSRAEWLALCAPQLVEDGQGGLVPRYDPALAVPLRALTPEQLRADEAARWQAWDRLRCPALVLRGAQSDVLAPQTAAAMAARGPRARVHEFAGVGHAPTLVHADQIEIVRRFLLDP